MQLKIASDQKIPKNFSKFLMQIEEKVQSIMIRQTLTPNRTGFIVSNMMTNECFSKIETAKKLYCNNNDSKNFSPIPLVAR